VRRECSLCRPLLADWGQAVHGVTSAWRLLIGVNDWRSVQDIEALVRTARRRAADEKATVRKAGVALLEALLLLRAAPPAPLPRLPSGPDIAALEAAARDPLVNAVKLAFVTLGAASVRRGHDHGHMQWHGAEVSGWASSCRSACARQP
jgi:hypothetical protein